MGWHNHCGQRLALQQPRIAFQLQPRNFGPADTDRADMMLIRRRSEHPTNGHWWHRALKCWLDKPGAVHLDIQCNCSLAILCVIERVTVCVKPRINFDDEVAWVHHCTGRLVKGRKEGQTRKEVPVYDELRLTKLITDIVS
jgi:hypothetical protein